MCTRTIERDIVALQESGVPIYAEAGRRGGYLIDRTVTLPPLNFTATEMAAIAVMAALAEGTPFAVAARGALRKIVAGAPKARTGAAAIVDRIRVFSPGSGGSGPVPGMVPLVVQDAIAERHVLVLEYRSRFDEITVREVEPVAFTGGAAYWYLLAWCRLREAMRVFRVDRVIAAKDTGEIAPARDFDEAAADIPEGLLRRLDLTGQRAE